MLMDASTWSQESYDQMNTRLNEVDGGRAWTIGLGQAQASEGTIDRTNRPPRPPKRSGIIRVSHTLLHQLLKLPDNCEITHVYSGYVDSGDQFFVKVDSPYLPEVQEGAVLPNVTIQELEGFDE